MIEEHPQRIKNMRPSIKRPKDSHRRNKLESPHPCGVLAGIVPRSGDFVVMTREGAVAARAIRRLSEDQKKGHSFHEQSKRSTVEFQGQCGARCR